MGSTHQGQHPQDWNGAKKSCKICSTLIPQQIECEWDSATPELATARSPKTTSETCHAVQDPPWHGISQDQHLTPAARIKRHAHRSSYLVNEATSDNIRQLFFPRAVREWNSLPAIVLDAPSLESFKARLVRGNTEWSTKTNKFLAELCTCTYASVLFYFTLPLKLCHPTHWQSLQTGEVVN